MKTKYLAFAALAALLASCSNEEDFTPQVDSFKNTPITVSAMVGELVSTRAGYETNAEDASKSVLPEKFYLTVTQEAGVENSPYNYTDVEMTKGDDNSYTEPDEVQMLWKDETPSPSAITAYTIDTRTDVKVQNDQSTSDNVVASDLLGAIYTTDNNSDITITGANIGINFRHLLCKLDITLSWGTELDNATTKEITGVTISGLNTTAKLDRTTATVSTNEATVADINAYITANGGVYTAEAIFTPSSANPAITIFTKIDGEERVFSLTPNAPTDGFVSGCRYTVSITVGGSIVHGVTATVANGWAEETGGNMATE